MGYSTSTYTVVVVVVVDLTKLQGMETTQAFILDKCVKCVFSCCTALCGRGLSLFLLHIIFCYLLSPQEHLASAPLMPGSEEPNLGCFALNNLGWN